MKRRSILTFLIAAIITIFSSCEKDNNPGNGLPELSGCIKGRLEIQGICSNYTVKVMSGTVDPSLIEASWTNPATGKTHENVFRLEDPCSFPPSIKQGDEFYFKIIKNPNTNCGICQAAYPTPNKGLAIQVLTSACEGAGINK